MKPARVIEPFLLRSITSAGRAGFGRRMLPMSAGRFRIISCRTSSLGIVPRALIATLPEDEFAT